MKHFWWGLTQSSKLLSDEGILYKSYNLITPWFREKLISKYIVVLFGLKSNSNNKKTDDKIIEKGSGITNEVNYEYRIALTLGFKANTYMWNPKIAARAATHKAIFLLPCKIKFMKMIFFSWKRQERSTSNQKKEFRITSINNKVHKMKNLLCCPTKVRHSQVNP